MIASANVRPASEAVHPAWYKRGVRSSGLMLGIGLAIGAAVGAGGMYLALRKPADKAPAAAAPVDAGADVAKKPKKKRGGGGSSTAPPAPGELDTRMQWKGDAVERPPATVDMSSDADARSLEGSEIQAGIDAGGGALTDCIGKAVGDSAWSGDITLELLVDGDGKVAKSRVRAPAFTFDRGLAACMRQGAARLRFAAVGGWTVVTVPFPVTIE
jgi:hypothetical protein